MFALGELVATRGIADKIKVDTQFAFKIAEILERYINCDFGNISKEDIAENMKAIENNERIFAVYKVDGSLIYVITEWDRSCTTVLFAHEY